MHVLNVCPLSRLLRKGEWVSWNEKKSNECTTRNGMERLYIEIE